ncbi:hypothetical protein [[Clostridium] colinum]|uniref:hypothetical protein n=1 Tax=[Clostridium] colinum TaxID=36835 RepID=UPI0020247F81|nr:hypothetical protein [[Clostridium] colinum]
MQYSIKDFFNNSVNIMEEPKYNTNENNTEFKEENSSDVGYIREREVTLMRKLYSEINSFLYPFVVEVLDEFEFIGSPIYNISGIDRETISQMVDRVINLAEETLDQVGEAKNERTGNYLREWDRWGLLRSTVESLLLNDIFAIRRPNYYNKYASNISSLKH